MPNARATTHAPFHARRAAHANHRQVRSGGGVSDFRALLDSPRLVPSSHVSPHPEADRAKIDAFDLPRALHGIYRRR